MSHLSLTVDGGVGGFIFERFAEMIRIAQLLDLRSVKMKAMGSTYFAHQNGNVLEMADDQNLPAKIWTSAEINEELRRLING